MQPKLHTLFVVFGFVSNPQIDNRKINALRQF